MKRCIPIILGSILFCSQLIQAQEPDSVIAARKARIYADTLVKCWFYQDWKSYTDFTCPTAVKYYGGKEAFKEHLTTIYFRNEPRQDEKPEVLTMLGLRNEDDQWQCVFEKVRNTYINDEKAIVYTYLVGQSLDNGLNWKFVDVNQNSMDNVPFLLPTIFNDMAIPKARTLYPDRIVAQPVEEAPKTKKKVVTKKK
jgi:hypothetical protein